MFGRPALHWADMSEMSRLSRGAMAWKSISCLSPLQLYPALVARPYLARLIYRLIFSILFDSSGFTNDLIFFL